jgi:hypothetical protein
VKKRLDISDCCITNDGLKNIKVVEVLNLSGCTISVKGLKFLKVEKGLILNDCEFSCEDLEKVFGGGFKQIVKEY